MRPVPAVADAWPQRKVRHRLRRRRVHHLHRAGVAEQEFRRRAGFRVVHGLERIRRAREPEQDQGVQPVQGEALVPAALRRRGPARRRADGPALDGLHLLLRLGDEPRDPPHRRRRARRLVVRVGRPRVHRVRVVLLHPALRRRGDGGGVRGGRGGRGRGRGGCVRAPARSRRVRAHGRLGRRLLHLHQRRLETQLLRRRRGDHHLPPRPPDVPARLPRRAEPRVPHRQAVRSRVLHAASLAHRVQDAGVARRDGSRRGAHARHPARAAQLGGEIPRVARASRRRAPRCHGPRLQVRARGAAGRAGHRSRDRRARGDGRRGDEVEAARRARDGGRGHRARRRVSRQVRGSLRTTPAVLGGFFPRAPRVARRGGAFEGQEQRGVRVFVFARGDRYLHRPAVRHRARSRSGVHGAHVRPVARLASRRAVESRPRARQQKSRRGARRSRRVQEPVPRLRRGSAFRAGRARARGRAQDAGDRGRDRGGGRRRRSAGPRRRRRGDARRRRRSRGRRGGARARNFFVAPGGTRTRAGTRARG